MAYIPLQADAPPPPNWPTLLSEYRLPGQLGTMQTIAAMRNVYNEAIHDERVKLAGVNWTNACSRNDHDCFIRSILANVRPRWQYIDHPAMCQEIFTPDVHLERLAVGGQTWGDCANLALFYASVAGALGVPTRLQIVDTGTGNGWDHVRAQALVDEKWVSMDFIDMEIDGLKTMEIYL